MRKYILPPHVSYFPYRSHPRQFRVWVERLWTCSPYGGGWQIQNKQPLCYKDAAVSEVFVFFFFFNDLLKTDIHLDKGRVSLSIHMTRNLFHSLSYFSRTPRLQLLNPVNIFFCRTWTWSRHLLIILLVYAFSWEAFVMPRFRNAIYKWWVSQANGYADCRLITLGSQTFMNLCRILKSLPSYGRSICHASVWTAQYVPN